MIYKWQLNGLDCAHCAGVIEQKVNKLELVDKFIGDLKGNKKAYAKLVFLLAVSSIFASTA